MSLRAILMGFLFAMLVAMGGHFNDVYMQQTFMVGNFFPISVIGFLVVLVLIVSPLLYWIRPRWKLRVGELAVIVALPMAVCVVPGSGLLRTLTPVLAMPKHYEKMTPSWQKSEVLSYVPDNLLVRAEDKSEEEDVLGGFLQGKGSADRHIGFRDIPWKAWMPALSAWIPLFLVLMVGFVGLSLVLHRQWTTHEHLVYPVAEFVQLLTGKDGGRAYPALLRDRLFWYGFVSVLVIHVVNGLHAWFPTFIEIPHRIDLIPLKELFPRLARAPGAHGLFVSHIFFSVVAFSFFLPSDITLSLGLTNLVGGFFSLLLITYGVSVTSVLLGAGEVQGLIFGAYVGLFALIVFSGRKYYGRVLLAAFGKLQKDTSLESSAVWGCRVCLLASVLGTVLLMRMGLASPVAIMMVLLMTLMFVAMSRMCAETGLFFIQPYWYPAGILLGLFGTAALGPQMLAVAVLSCLVICIDQREALMPYIVNALRIAENARVKRGRLAVAMSFTFVTGLVVGLVVVLWLQYDRGVGMSDRWAVRSVPTLGFRFVDSEIQKIMADGLLGQAKAAEGLQRFGLIRPNKSFTAFLLTGFLLFSSCAFLRIRFPKWPLHPVLFLVWFTYPLREISTSFFIGWAVKSLVVKFGGGNTYQRVKPLMVGLIAGDLTGGLTFMIVGAVYYFVTGFPPQQFSIFPG